MAEDTTYGRVGIAKRALLQALIPFAVAGLFVWKGRQVAAGVIAGIGAVVLLSGLLTPFLFLKIEQGGRWLGKAAGIGLTWLLLTPMFYLVFFPGRLILMMTGKDPMARKFPTKAPTYWIARKPVGSPDEYKRQY